MSVEEQRLKLPKGFSVRQFEKQSRSGSFTSHDSLQSVQVEAIEEMKEEQEMTLSPEIMNKKRALCNPTSDFENQNKLTLASLQQKNPKRLFKVDPVA